MCEGGKKTSVKESGDKGHLISSDVGRDHLVAALRTESYVFAEGFRGYDPYDALLSPIFNLPLLRSSKIPRLAAQQILRRLPVNLRALLGIRRGLNPVSLGLAVEAYAYLAIADPENAQLYRSRALFCIDGAETVAQPWRTAVAAGATTFLGNRAGGSFKRIRPRSSPPG